MKTIINETWHWGIVGYRSNRATVEQVMAIVNANVTFEETQMSKNVKCFKNATVNEPDFENANAIMSKKATELTEQQKKRDKKFFRIATEIIKGNLTQSQIQRRFGLSYGMYGYYRDKVLDDDKFEKAM